MLLRPVGDSPLADPGHEVLVHDVAGDPAPVCSIADRAVPVGDLVLRERLHLVRHAVEEPADAQRVLVVDGHAPFEVAAGEQAVRPEAGPPDRPQLVVLGLAFQDAAVDEAVLELVEADLEVGRRLRPVVAPQGPRPVAVQPLEVHRVDRVLLALEPVAGNFREDDLDEAVPPGERLPGGHERRRLRPQVGPEQAGLGLDGICLDPDPVFEARFGVGDLLERLVDAGAGLVEQPAVVVAAQAAAPRQSRTIGRPGGAGSAGPAARRCRPCPCTGPGLRPGGGPPWSALSPTRRRRRTASSSAAAARPSACRRRPPSTPGSVRPSTSVRVFHFGLSKVDCLTFDPSDRSTVRVPHDLRKTLAGC